MSCPNCSLKREESESLKKKIDSLNQQIELLQKENDLLKSENQKLKMEKKETLKGDIIEERKMKDEGEEDKNFKKRNLSPKNKKINQNEQNEDGGKQIKRIRVILQI